VNGVVAALRQRWRSCGYAGRLFGNSSYLHSVLEQERQLTQLLEISIARDLKQEILSSHGIEEMFTRREAAQGRQKQDQFICRHPIPCHVSQNRATPLSKYLKL
jgi:hypothetical protein